MDTLKLLQDFLQHLPAAYAPEFCDEESIKISQEYFSSRGGVLFVIGELNERLKQAGMDVDNRMFLTKIAHLCRGIE